MRAVASTLVLLDFDGTMTLRDADFVIADAALPPAMAHAYEPLADAYERLEISAKEYFEGFLRIVALPPAEFAGAARRVPFRPGLRDFVVSLEQAGVELTVLSEGLDVYIVPALAHAGLGHLALSCNRAEWCGGGYTVWPAPDAAPCPRCLNCKGAHVRRAQAQGKRVVVVGNGASDLCGARCADQVFARDGLVAHCVREGIAYRPFDDFTSLARAVLASPIPGEAAPGTER